MQYYYYVHAKNITFMLWFKFIVGSNFIFLCLKLITTDYHTPKQRKINLSHRIKLNHHTYNSYIRGFMVIIKTNKNNVYSLMNKQECFIKFKTPVTAECFRLNKERTVTLLSNSLKISRGTFIHSRTNTCI